MAQQDRGPDRREMVDHPAHYNGHPSGVECIDIVRWFNFNKGNAIKYVWRAGDKGDPYYQEIEDLKKAVWYLTDEIERITMAHAAEQSRDQEA